MTAFFVPGTPSGEHTDRAYEDLCRYAESAAGRPPRSRRIFALSCRRGGMDSEARVGRDDPVGGDLVHAIFDVGDGYLVVWRNGHTTVTKRQTYEAVDFD